MYLHINVLLLSLPVHVHVYMYMYMYTCTCTCTCTCTVYYLSAIYRDKTVPSWTHSGSIHISRSSNYPHGNKPHLSGMAKYKPTSANKVYIPHPKLPNPGTQTTQCTTKRLPVIISSLNSSPVRSVAMATGSSNATMTTKNTCVVKPLGNSSSSPKNSKSATESLHPQALKTSCPRSKLQNSLSTSPSGKKENGSRKTCQDDQPDHADSRKIDNSVLEESMDISICDAGDTVGDTGDTNRPQPVVIGEKRRRGTSQQDSTDNLQLCPQKAKRRKISRFV